MKSRHAIGLLTFLGAAIPIGLAVSCASVPDTNRYTAVLAPDFPTYRDQLDSYIEKQCGTLDCHGQPGRPFRVYGYRGLRLYNVEAGLIPGQQTTTPDEIEANFLAMIAVEPEEMSRVIARNGADPDQLLLLRKATNAERHKGGEVMSTDGDAYICFTGWLALEPNVGATLDPKTLSHCTLASMDQP